MYLLKHARHVRDTGHCPIANVLIEGSRFIEHEGHVSDMGYIPIGNVGIESTAIRKERGEIFQSVIKAPVSNWTITLHAK